jgi:hypothetical protein
LIIEERLQIGKPQVCDAGIELYSRAAKLPEAGSLKCCQKYTQKLNGKLTKGQKLGSEKVKKSSEKNNKINEK